MNTLINNIQFKFNKTIHIIQLSMLTYVYNCLIKNGLYILLLSIFIYLLIGDIYISTFLFLKGYISNYYYLHAEHYPQPKFYKYIHFFRLTDSGHIASLLFMYNKKFTPLVHNVHFVIDVGYYISYFCFQMKAQKTYINSFIEKIYESLLHTIFYIYIVHYILTNNDNNNINNINNINICNFDDNTLYYTFIWINSWFIFVYIPWVYFTNIYLYNILEPTKPFYLRLSLIVFMNSLVYISNQTGKYICSF